MVPTPAPTPAPAASPPPAPAPSSILSPTDPATWVMVGSVVAAVVLNVWHRDVSAYVPLAAVGVAGLVVTGGLVAKHRYAAALDAAVALIDRLDQSATVGHLRAALVPHAHEAAPAAHEAAATAAAPHPPAPAAPAPAEGPPPPLSLGELARLLRAAGYHIEDLPPPAPASVSVPPPAPAGPSLPPLIPQGGPAATITTGPADG